MFPLDHLAEKGLKGGHIECVDAAEKEGEDENDGHCHRTCENENAEYEGQHHCRCLGPEQNGTARVAVNNNTAEE